MNYTTITDLTDYILDISGAEDLVENRHNEAARAVAEHIWAAVDSPCTDVDVDAFLEENDLWVLAEEVIDQH